MLGVASLVAIDVTILVLYTLVEGIQGDLVARQVAHKENPMEVTGVSTITSYGCIVFGNLRVL